MSSKKTSVAFAIVVFIFVAILGTMAVFVTRKAAALIREQQAEIQRLYDTNTKLYKQNLDLSYKVSYYERVNKALEELYVHRRKR